MEWNGKTSHKLPVKNLATDSGYLEAKGLESIYTRSIKVPESQGRQRSAIFEFHLRYPLTTISCLYFLFTRTRTGRGPLHSCAGINQQDGKRSGGDVTKLRECHRILKGRGLIALKRCPGNSGSSQMTPFT
ncbi:hypothetical protein CDAR_488131 [Caerostris darwini]|uniref:Uncharacterized protein n=1 Tax=Caerostris darwini TaxID=1538125 RepID=A0AAV4R751_9ARAC|nr:hypothetical protein CDAR_488131 [Caerostris darwini]